MHPNKLTHPKVKFCGMTREEDVQYAVDLGVNAIGMIMVPGSVREVKLVHAKVLRALIPEHITAVVVVRNATREAIIEIIHEVKPDVIQFHGQETPEFCEQFDYPYWKVIAIRDETSVEQMASFPRALAFLFDSWSKDGGGGQGDVFDWALLPQTFNVPGVFKRNQPMKVLAGGLNPENIMLTKPLIAKGSIDMLDLSSGIEAPGTAQIKGIKCHAAMQAFMLNLPRLI